MVFLVKIAELIKQIDNTKTVKINSTYIKAATAILCFFYYVTKWFFS